MNRIFTLVSAILLSANLWAQSPQSFSYQALVRGANNALVANKKVGIKISLLQGSETGTAVYVETHTPTSNENGLVSIAIGGGTKDPFSPAFATIDWSKGPYFVKTETDPSGGTSYSLITTSQLLSVPYALYAANSQPGAKGDKGDTGTDGKDGTDGLLGAKGDAGTDGKDGLPGAKGDTGTNGKDGLPGAKGDAGADGKDGLPGAKGDDGTDGKDGLPGAKGDTGTDGKDGTDGLPGAKGDAGADGKDGLPGAKGDAGADGKDGTDGLLGAKGDAGTDGKDGQAGNGFSNGTATNQIMYWNGSAWSVLNPGTIGQSLMLCEDGLTWSSGGVCPTRPTSGYGGNIIDLDGNSYKTVYIGTQKWLAENLKVSKYNDGTAIPNESDDTQWSDLTGAWAYYNNDASNDSKYGKLYNWYAVSPSTNGNKNVCPTGWHVPTDVEWTILTDYLGGEMVSGGKMKEVGLTNWNGGRSGKNVDATNTSLFTGLPGGYRTNKGLFSLFGGYGYWWSSSENNNTYDAWFRYLNSQSGIAVRYNFVQGMGLSVRCLRD